MQSFPRPFAISLGTCIETEGEWFIDSTGNHQQNIRLFQTPGCFERMKHVQENYRNCAAIIICENKDQWSKLNVEFPPGVMRLHFVRNINEMYTALDELYNEMSLTVAGVNLKNQASFFLGAKNRLCHSKSCMRVYVETLGKLNIPSHEREEIIMKLPSIKAMVAMDAKKVARKIHADKEHLQSLEFFFCPPLLQGW